MIVNVGGRTDIVNYYSEWLMNRIKEGFAYSRNPLFPNNVSKISLNPKDEAKQDSFIIEYNGIQIRLY